MVAGVIFAASFYKVTARNGKLLEESSGVVDDLYRGCRQQAMDKFIVSGLLEQELNQSAGFQKAWSSNPGCTTLIPGGEKIHTAALSAYYNGDAQFLQNLDKQVETLAVNVSTYEDSFNFKSLHFLLMDSMTLLKPKECQTVFLVQEEPKAPKKGSTVRFGSFTLATSSFAELLKLNDIYDQVVLNVTSCFFVNVGKYVCSKHSKDVFLSPAEEFTVEEVNSKIDDEDKYTEVVLKHSKLNSTHNCFGLSRSAAGITLWPVSVLLAISFLSLAV